MKLILASKSPRRIQLLEEMGYEFEIRTRSVKECFDDTSSSNEKAVRLAKEKAVAQRDALKENEVILTADTIVDGGKMLGKPKTKEEAKQMLRTLSGSTHRVVTGVYIGSFLTHVQFSVETIVHFKLLTEVEVNHYTNTKEPYDKAGAYGINGYAALFIDRIEGDYYNVVGLPLSRVYKELQTFGVVPTWAQDE
ncbi:nucleoside triphosphate pyrophosphatase [Geomicrobium sp. JCM 19055]|uniref:Maf family protein n=1 Tax=Geomicrobium sp. JCM 19055 TaxID=1460649 RepID=UPI00045ECF16|nr:Maf family protein [Geomicrobium sp. JCM 19055]GAJ99219.1 septum formation protein Maf [Geomicrobium sp. JCM 19055]